MQEQQDKNTNDIPNGSVTERFLRLLMANQGRIYAYILTLVPNWSDADDIMQEATAVMWRKFDKFKSGTDFAAWGVSIAHYEILKFRKRNRRNHLHLNENLLRDVAEKCRETKDEKEKRLCALQECLTKLSEQDRRLIRLRYERYATTKRVAQRVGRSVQGMYKTMARIHYALQQCVRRVLVMERTL